MTEPSETNPLGTRYDPSGIEAPLYARWLARGSFHVDAENAVDPFVMVIPPPNVTAALHMGHGLNNTIQDVLIRYQRMCGRDAVWIPGTDHAGIATQNVVEQQLAAEGTRRQDLGREAFVERMWEWVDEYGTRIVDQLKTIGCSCDWERTRFTLDEGLSRAVREVFVRLYEKDLIYRGNYIINWCPRCLTALSNEEAEHQEVDGKLYHLRYPLCDSSGESVVVATTRPETMLGDTAVAVHPDDERYRSLIGREVELPLTGRRIPIIADTYVDPEFGSGFVKITPAHDPNDFEVGARHGLPSIDVMNDDASMGDNAPEAYRGLDRFEARSRVVADLDAAGLLERIEDHRHSVGHCYRCDTAVEPRLSLQWFVQMRPLAEPALAAYRDGRLRFHPQRYGATYEHWLTNVRDWCISRQLWWGHRLPVWYCDACDEVIVSRIDPDTCPACAGQLRQDPDVLDTWFSSWLWPFSTLGWPEQTPDLATFYPTSALSTAPEILFFWVARMVMAGLEFMGDLPFTDVLMHGTVRDAAGRKMSKSLGNGVDPLEVVEKFGADAMRYTLVSAAAIGTDMHLDHADLEGSFKVGRNFANKIWNAVRFALAELRAEDVNRSPADTRLEVADQWILSRFGSEAREITGDFDRFRLHEAAERTYRFVWGDFCDWYLELVKPRLRGDRGAESRDAAAATLAFVLDGWLRLLHPVMPFITEELFCHLPGRDSDDTLLAGPWPAGEDIRTWDVAVGAMEDLQELVGVVRNLRSEYGIDPGRRVELIVANPSAGLRHALAEEQAGALSLARLSSLAVMPAIPSGVPGAHAVLRTGAELFLPLEGIVDLDRERVRLSDELQRLQGLLESAAANLANPGFTERAPPEIVDREREKRRSLEQRLERLLEKRQAFLMHGG
ncbi:MAG: valine--tRNA ligase [Gemmatimonadota bacterium]|nr:valine--tRNA ligase [Gemmatimonadota bacterium]MDH3427125.1 valine--tRNA ligase [Gemmatimonadota bacterium]